MGSVKSVEELEVFKKAHSLTVNVYKISTKFPAEEKFGLITQIRRSAASVCANLMEGSHRLGRKEFRQFVGISRGSAGELKYHLLLAKDLGYLPNKDFIILRSEAEEISKMLYGLANSLSDTHTDTVTKT
jgi:four helix bundle protein